MLRATLLISSALVLAGCQAIPLASNEPAAPAAPAAAKTNAMAQAGLLAPMVERRETLTGTGYAVISVQNHRTAAQQRLMAIRASRLDAYRSLAEQVYGQYLDANTTVADMVVMSDTFRSRVEGVIYGAVLVSITPVGDDTYETTLSLDRGVVEDLRALYLNQLAARRN
jgi:outer membrane protein FlgP